MSARDATRGDAPRDATYAVNATTGRIAPSIIVSIFNPYFMPKGIRKVVNEEIDDDTKNTAEETQTSFDVVVGDTVITTYTAEVCGSVEDAYDRATKVAKKKGGRVA